MTIKPFAIQGADITLGGVNLQAGTTGVVIPGITQAASYTAEEVNDTGDQTVSWTLPPAVIDQETFNILSGNIQAVSGWVAPTYEVTELDDEGFIDGIDIVTPGTIPNSTVAAHLEDNMFAARAFRVMLDAQESQAQTGQIGGYSFNAFPQRLNAYNMIGWTVYLGTTPTGVTIIDQDNNMNGGATVGLQFDNNIDAGSNPLWNFLPPDYPLVDFDANDWTAIPFSVKCRAGEVEIIGGGGSGNQLVNTDSGDTLAVMDTGDVILDGEGPGAVNRGLVWQYGDNLDGLNSQIRQDQSGLTVRAWTENNEGNFSAPVNIVTNQDTNQKTWTFDGDGALTFPDGTIQTTAYTGQSGGGSGELYIMANVDGNIITSTDGQTWGEPIASGVPAFISGPFNATIGKVEIHGGVIVYTRSSYNTDGPKGTGLYYSTEIGTATLCVGTDSSPGGDLYWNEVHFFHETDKWVAVGYSQYGQDTDREPIFAYSTDGISWTVSFVDSNFVADHNAGNWPWEMTDVAYNPTDNVYVFVGKVGGGNHAGAFVTNDLTVTFNADIWVDVALNAKFIVNFNVVQFGGPPGYMMIANADTEGVWSTMSPVTNPSNWNNATNSPTSGWYQDPMISNFGYVPEISEMTANGTTVVITTADGQVAVPGMGMNVTIPQVYTSNINDIFRSERTINQFTTSPAVGESNPNWVTDYDGTPTINGDQFHVVVTGGQLITCDSIANNNLHHNVGDTIMIQGSFFGGTNGLDDITVTITSLINESTLISFSGNDQDGNKITPAADGEKIVISGVTTYDPSEPGRTDQSYNGTYYIKTISGDPNTYELYTDQALTQRWDTTDYWVTNGDGTLTWSHGQFIDAAGCANSYYYIGNDDEKIFRSTDGGYTWVEQTDLTGAYLNDFAYGTWGGNASTTTDLTVQSPFVVDFFGDAIYFAKDNNGSQVDTIDTNVAITRSYHQGIYNPITDSEWNNNTDGPTNTEWNMDGWGDLSNVKTRQYTSWANVCNGGTNTQNREFVMHDTENDKYYAIKFHTFQGGEGGGAFSYTRRLINTACWFNRADNDDSGYGDEIDTGLKIVRGNNEAIYNDLDEGGWDEAVSPTGTLWNAQGWGDLTDVTTRQYLNFAAACKYAIGKAVCGIEFVMKDTINNKYYAIKFNYWGHGGNGNGTSYYPGFAYTRRQIDLTKVSSNVKFADGTIQTTAVTEQRLGVLPQKLVDNNQYRYLTLDDVGKHLFVTASNTRIVITDSIKEQFPIGSVITIINKSGGDIYVYKDNDDESGTIYGSAQDNSGTGWYVNDSGSGNLITIIKIAEYYDGNPYSDWMICGTGIGLD